MPAEKGNSRSVYLLLTLIGIRHGSSDTIKTYRLAQEICYSPKKNKEEGLMDKATFSRSIKILEERGYLERSSSGNRFLIHRINHEQIKEHYNKIPAPTDYEIASIVPFSGMDEDILNDDDIDVIDLEDFLLE